MKRVAFFIIASLFVITLFSTNSVDGAIGLQWSFEEGDLIEYRLISDGLVSDEIIHIRIDSPLPEWCELPPDTYSLSALDNWMEIPLVPVTALIPFGSSISEVEGFDDLFSYCGLAAGYWCRFALPDGISNDTYAPLIERWSDGPHGTIAPTIVQTPIVSQYIYWGFTYGFEFSDTIYNVSARYFLDDMYLSNLTITGHDSESGEQTHYMNLVTDQHEPLINFPDDLNFTLGTTEEEILWHAFDFPPYWYTVYRNGTLILSGEADISNQWVHVNLDDLDVGVWNYTIVVSDFLLQTVSDTVMVTVYSNFPLSSDMLLVIGAVGIIAIVGVIVVVRRR